MLASVSYVVFKQKFIGRNKTFISIITESSVCYSVEYSVGDSDHNFVYKWMAFTCPVISTRILQDVAGAKVFW